MLVDIPAPSLDIGLQIGDAVDDRHGNSRLRVLSVSSSLARTRDPPNTPAAAAEAAAMPPEQVSAMSPNRTLVLSIRV
jgi:hypothetical protein